MIVRLDDIAGEKERAGQHARDGATVTTARERLRHAAAVILWTLVMVTLATVLLSAVLGPGINWTVRTALLGFGILAIARPDAALVTTIALIGFGIILSHLAGVPSLRVAELLVVASLAGCWVRAFPRATGLGRAIASSISAPVVLLAVLAAASTAVRLRVYQVETGYPSTYLRALLDFVSRDYFVQPGDFMVIVSTAAIVEGLALYVVVVALCRIDATFSVRAMRMLAIGGAGIGFLSIVRLAEILLRNPHAIETLRATSVGLRISPQIPDYIAAGSYFAVCWLAGLGLALSSSRGRLRWVAAGVPLIAGLYLTGSRSVLAAAVAGVFVLFLMVEYRRTAAVRRVVAFAVLAVAVMVLTYSWMSGRDVAGEMARQSLTVRTELMRAGLRVIETQPLFGIGIDRFFLVADGFASPELKALWQGRMNPHNDFLRFAAELGLLGVGMFVWILAEAGKRIWKALPNTHDPLLAGLAGGLVAFLVTSLVSNPLMVREVSYVFWIALGLAVGRSAGVEQPDASLARMPRPAAAPPRRSYLRWAIVLLVGAATVLSIPLRARQELAAVDMTRLSYGLFEWGVDAQGTRCRWSGPRATLFVDGRARIVEIPLSGVAPSGSPQQVEVRVDGRLANRVTVGVEWLRLRTVLPPGPSTSAHRIDFMVSPSFVPAEVLPGSQEMREHGVKVGEVSIITAPAQTR